MDYMIGIHITVIISVLLLIRLAFPRKFGNVPDQFMLELPSSGIESIEGADNETAEYFSLQGLRIDRPADGQMVIVRKGGKSFKTVYRAR